MSKRKTIQRSARWAALGSPIRKKMRAVIIERDGTACHHCGRPTQIPQNAQSNPSDMTIDHWPVPRKHLPESEWLDPSRAVIACLACNRRMNDESQRSSTRS